ncbi:hypothetical protein GWI33_015494 [Rhynchophorus ferrugineus]|uniref:Uncharacterized protein n=1 Tax=Rhynchophorus ferrugineus TaxID=354439 RepID=A0A834I582_RHYFE|nr:hypothetical protein GWI33_015494 [Rhynchophorus ferrugineus]
MRMEEKKRPTMRTKVAGRPGKVTRPETGRLGRDDESPVDFSKTPGVRWTMGFCSRARIISNDECRRIWVMVPV